MLLIFVLNVVTYSSL